MRPPAAGVDSLLRTGLAVLNPFLEPGEVVALRECAALRAGRGEFSEARIGAGAAQRRAEIRGDFLCWLTEPLFAAERDLIGAFERLRLALNRRGHAGAV